MISIYIYADFKRHVEKSDKCQPAHHLTLYIINITTLVLYQKGKAANKQTKNKKNTSLFR